VHNLDMVIEEAKKLQERAKLASIYPANELVVIAQMLELLATQLKLTDARTRTTFPF